MLNGIKVKGAARVLTPEIFALEGSCFWGTFQVVSLLFLMLNILRGSLEPNFALVYESEYLRGSYSNHS